MRIFYQPVLDEKEKKIILSTEDSKHALRVLRLKEGDEVHLVDGKGRKCNAIISDANMRKCQLEITHFEQEEKPYQHRIHIAVAPTKNMDRIEYFVEKSVELGIDRISFIQTENSERKVVKLERVNRIAVSAMKQSKKSFLPEVGELVSFEQFLKECQDEQKFIAYVPENPDKHLFKDTKPNNKVCVLIGPEGGFTPEEVGQAQASGFEAVSLGNSRLRTETAALAACHIVNIVNL